MPSLLATVLLSGIIGAPAPSEAPPGGYLTLGEQRERASAPPDGEDELTIGSVLFSLGLLRVGAAVLTVWMADRPSMCPAAEPEEQSCASLRTYGYVGLGEGGLLTGTGIVYLAIGASRRRQYRSWQRGEPLAQSLAPPLAPSLASWRALSERVQLSPWIAGPRRSGPWAAERRGLTGGGVFVQLRF